ncbi:transglycosylase domain-containing protein [Alkalihalobacterium chitinilyticum]|uniref:Penicillin-binding protein n=1 Tax=Alkalihalobacterium chitinilyticum TaxID=2980103 RepID=A0ABT5VNN2_9BACI|nr:transglycosylase domain-containing protein [Alkalihalobacterium chitinilyticum]MDE5415889.1 penicillin-binding protein [Alkalihalobacterium chitinilyticum]
MRNLLNTLTSKCEQVVNFLRRKKILSNLDITYQVVWNLFLVFLVFGVISLFFVGGAGAGFFASLVKDEQLRSYEAMKKDIYNYEEVSEIYFANDVYLGELPTDLERREIPLKDISPHLINAIIATEDEYFYEHEGIVPKAIMRATFQEFTNASLQTGGSTLTQQLVKNQILTSEVSFDRKAREIVLAMRLEHFFEKDEILEAYLNIVPFGRNANGRNIAGVQAAAQGIFGVDAKDLSIPQAAFIAGLPQSPFGYTPFYRSEGKVVVKENLDPGINRMKTVLRRMHEGGHITEQEYQEALNYDIRANLTAATPSIRDEYPYIADEVVERAVSILTNQYISEEGIELEQLDAEERLEIINKHAAQARIDLRQNGYRIHTTIDKDIHDAMNEAIKDERFFGPPKDGEPEEVGSMLIENRTGAILGFVGGRDFEREQLNHATNARRPNGSTMKPLLAYGPAMDIGALQPGHIIPDVPTFYKSDSSRQVNNFNRSHRGLITVREALKTSQNTTAVRGLWMAPHEKSRETLLKMGFRLNPGEPYEAAALGAIDHNVTVENNTNAYATFANGGKYIPSHMIDRIETKDGEVIFEHQIEEVEVFSPQTSYLMIDMMRDVLRGGTASSLPGRLKFRADWAGKTGTTQDFYDVWFVATNPNVTMSVWIGYDTPKEIKREPIAGLSYSQRTQQIWANIANAAYDVRPEVMSPGHNFQMPDGIVSRAICGVSGLLPSDLCKEAGLVKTDLFNAKFAPTKVDDSLQKVNYVLIDDQPYVALENTPKEFTFNGVMIKEEYLETYRLSESLQNQLSNVIPDRKAKHNGKQPSAVKNVSLSGSTLSWAKQKENDIVGYRIYQAPNGSDQFKLITSVKGSATTSHNIKSGSYAYYVTAVDVAGKESPASNIAKGDNWSAEPPKEEKEEKEPKKDKKEDEDKKPKPPSGDNGDPRKPSTPKPPSESGGSENNG